MTATQQALLGYCRRRSESGAVLWHDDFGWWDVLRNPE
jgi:hypothetical protein